MSGQRLMQKAPTPFPPPAGGGGVPAAPQVTTYKGEIAGVNARGLAASVERHLCDYFAAHENGLPAAGLYDRVLHEIERPLLHIALTECRGNQLRAAELLGLNRNTLRKKIRELGLDAARTRKSRGSA